MKELIQKLKETQNLSKEEWISLIENRSVELSDYLFAQAREVRHQYYGKESYVRGQITVQMIAFTAVSEKAMRILPGIDLQKKIF